MTIQSDQPTHASTEATAPTVPTGPAGARMAPPPKLRRRPLLWALGVALVAVGGLLAAWITTTVSDTEPVLALRADVDRGSVIEAEDLQVVHLSGDPALELVSADDQDQVIGKRAARDLTAGSPLAASAVTDAVVPGEGESLVGVALTRSQLPASTLRAGDVVRIINTPRAQDDLSATTPFTVEATVVRVRSLEDVGQVVVDVTVPTREATALATLVATGRVALVVDGGE